MLSQAIIIFTRAFIYTLLSVYLYSYGYYSYIMENDEMLAYVINKMRKIRISKDMSQMELCLRANMSQSFLANLEAGKKQPSLLSIIRIAKALDVNPREFFPESPQKNKDDIKHEIYELLNLL